MEVFTLSVPKSVVKFRKGNVTYVSNVDRTKYLISELSRAALRDVGKYVCRQFRSSFYSHFHRETGNVGVHTQYWVKKYSTETSLPSLVVGLKNRKQDRRCDAFYGAFQEFGSKNIPKLGLFHKAVEDNIPKIIEIESQYLSALESEAAALAKINEADYEGGADE